MKLLAIVLVIISLIKLLIIKELKYLNKEILQSSLAEIDIASEYLKYFLLFDGLLGIFCGLYILVI